LHIRFLAGCRRAPGLFSFRDQGKILGFAVPSSDSIAAAVKDDAAAPVVLSEKLVSPAGTFLRE
jgi:hypothetical protein